MKYSPSAESDLACLPSSVRDRVANKVEFFVRQNDPLAFAKKLSGYNAYRFRVGNYRVIFEISEKTVFILAIIKRDDVYRNL